MLRENSEVNIGKYIMHKTELLGKGATGSVYRGYNMLTNAPVAIKDIDLATINDQATKSLLANEQKALKLINHTNVLKLEEIVTVSGHLYIVTELLDAGTLQEMLAKRGPLPEEQAMALFRQILAGQDAIIQANVIHRDLKPANILMNSANTPKIIDFGYCEVIMGGGIVRAFNVGSPAYMAPQALLKTLYSEKSDSWSLGIILYEMIHGCTPDKGRNIKQFLQQIRLNPQLIENCIKPGLDKNVHQILLKSLQYNTAQRMSVTGMKYLADIYCMQKSQNQTRQPFAALSINNRQTPITNQPKKLEFRPMFNQLHKKTPQVDKLKRNLQNISKPNLFNQNICDSYRSTPINHNQPNSHGFISYLQFRQAAEPKTLANKPTVSPNATIGEYNHTSNQFSRISHSTNRGSSCLRDRTDKAFVNQSSNYWQNVSGKGLGERPHMVPAFRQVKVRYL